MSNLEVRNVILSIISALLISSTFYFNSAWILVFISLVPLFFIIQNKSPLKALKSATIVGTIAYFITTYWLIGTLNRFGGFPYPISVIFHLIISAYSGLLFGIFALIIRSGFIKNNSFKNTILIGLIWVAVEYYYPLLFPFSIASPLANYYPLIQIADIVGINFISFLVVIINITLYKAILSFRTKQNYPIKEITASVLLIITILIYGSFKTQHITKQIENSKKIKLGIVQANFGFTEKTKDNFIYMVNQHKLLSYDFNKPDLIIWPETAIQAFIPTNFKYLTINDEILIPDLEDSFFLVGGLSYDITNIEGKEEIENKSINKYNSAFLTDSKGRILSRFHKIKLLLFGEYLPFSQYIPAIKKLSPATGDYVPGNELNILSIKQKGMKIATLICYEDIIPSFSIKFKQKGANILINLTNDAWFGQSIAPYQHLLLAIPRAVETRTYLIRATNTGVSAIIDPLGRIMKQTDIFKQQTIESTVGLMENGNTFYVKYGNLIYPLCLSILVLCVFFIITSRRKNS